jgi:hypothetical protein
VFEGHLGLSPEIAAQWTALVEECRPILAREGMEAVQSLLVERGMSVLPAVAITRALLDETESPLRQAIETVLTSEARRAVNSAG